MLAGAAGGDEATWSRAIGDVQLYPVATRSRCNWSISATGSAKQLEAIAKAVETVSADHRYARAG